MAVSKFVPEITGPLIARVAEGLTLEDACRETEVSTKTVRGWLTAGRAGESQEYTDFAEAFESARETAADVKPPMDAAELARVVSVAARKGSVAAMKLRHEMLAREVGGDEVEKKAPADPLAAADELASRRAARA